MTWFLAVFLFAVGGLCIIGYNEQENYEKGKKLAKFAGAALIMGFSIVLLQIIIDSSDPNPFKDFSSIQKQDLVELCMKNENCNINDYFVRKPAS